MLIQVEKSFFERVNEYIKENLWLEADGYECSLVRRSIESIITPIVSREERKRLSEGWVYCFKNDCIFNPGGMESEFFSDEERQFGVIHGDGLVLMIRKKDVFLNDIKEEVSNIKEEVSFVIKNEMSTIKKDLNKKLKDILKQAYTVLNTPICEMQD